MKRLYLLVCLIFLLIVLFTNCKTKNSPPNAPSVPSGDSFGLVNTLYNFTSMASDPDNDRIAIRFAWADGETTDWGFYGASESTITKGHQWPEAGFYYVKAQTRDEHDEISSWSGGHQIFISNFTKQPNTSLPK